ncbi:MAG: hypothetical protein R3268_15540 [Acidiferrobacterales bacterium]|nr:hypothetical protein [Acidiferrobacterales bacterium]
MAVDRADFGPGQVLRAVRSEDTDDEKLYIECGQMAVVLDVTFIAAPDTRFDNRDWDPALETCESLLEALENDEHLAYLTERSGDPFHNVVPRMRLKFIDTYTGRIAVSSFTDACCAFEEVSKVDKYEMQELNRLASPFELLARQADGLCDE